MNFARFLPIFIEDVMEMSRLMMAIFGNATAKDTARNKHKAAHFYRDSDQSDEGETIFCKNNVCVFNREHIPGYFTLKACKMSEVYTRVILHWTSNALLEEKIIPDEQSSVAQPTSQVRVENHTTPGVFHVDLTEMKTLKLFFDDETSGHFVVGNHENHYKVFHFHLGGMNHLHEILENWNLSKPMRLPDEEGLRKKCFAVLPIYSFIPNQSLEESRYGPMTKGRWKTFFNEKGQLEDVSNFRKEVFFGGILPEVRQEAWPFLLHYYPFHTRTAERKVIKEKKAKEYSELSERRLNMPKKEYDKFWVDVQCTVDKDVVRTDRTHPYFSGGDNPNVEIMRQILLNYAYHQPDVGYNQGMSDLVASILCTVQDEIDAFWCFVGLMEKSLLVTSPKDDSMDYQLLYLKELLRIMATKFYAHLLLEDEGMDLLFSHRWLLLALKREFHDLHVMRMWEACWSLYQTEFFHIFLCVAIVLEYGDLVWQKSMRVDEMLNYFNNLALQMDGDRVLRQARSLLYKFRCLAAIPCTLRGLLSGPGAWDSATLPDIECTCHEVGTCKYLNRPTLVKQSEKENTDELKLAKNSKEKHHDADSEKKENAKVFEESNAEGEVDHDFHLTNMESNSESRTQEEQKLGHLNGLEEAHAVMSENAGDFEFKEVEIGDNDGNADD